MTFSATLNPIVYEGGVPVFIDTDPETWNMDPASLERAFGLYPEVKLVMYAELYGFPGKVDEIRDICRKHGALLIEDAAESMGATLNGKQCGSFGDYGAISYNGNKIITGSTGGCLLSALLLGHFGHIGRLCLVPEMTTLKLFRELGLVLFLVGAGIPGGAEFVEKFDPMYFVYGAFMTLLPMIVGFLFAKYVLKMSLLNNLGSLTGGMTSTPALGTLISVSGTEQVAAAYAATYPVALVLVVLLSQLLILLF
jgi:AspT/YidE/YbjL antiporter-like protein